MRKFSLALVAILALVGGGCKCALESSQVDQLKRNHGHIFPAYLEYVEKDASLSDGAKDSEKKLVEATERLVDKMKQSTED